MTDKPDVGGREARSALLEPPQHVIDVAVEVSGLSPCLSRRGVVIFRGDDIVTHGFNYKPRGFDCDRTDACKATCRVEAVHAEQHALLMAGVRVSGAELLHVKTVNGALVASGGPSCVQCSKLALVVGIKAVWLYHDTGWQRYEMAEFHRLSLEAAGDRPSPEETDELAMYRAYYGPPDDSLRSWWKHRSPTPENTSPQTSSTSASQHPRSPVQSTVPTKSAGR